jgi:hypothetical protein
MTPMLKASGTKGLKLKHDKLLASFAFTLNLHRYNKARRLLRYTPVVGSDDTVCFPPHSPVTSSRQALRCSHGDH